MPEFQGQKAVKGGAEGSRGRRGQAAKGKTKPKAAARDPNLVLLGAYVPKKLRADLIRVLGTYFSRRGERVFMSGLLRMGVSEVATYTVPRLSACLAKRAEEREPCQVFVGGYIPASYRDELVKLIGLLAVEEGKRVSVSELIRIGLEEAAQKMTEGASLEIELGMVVHPTPLPPDALAAIVGPLSGNDTGEVEKRQPVGAPPI